MKKILLLTCGTNACFHIAKILKEKFPNEFYIVGTDINKQWYIPSCGFIDKFYQSPYTSDSSFYDYILNICKVEKIDYLIPSFDETQFLFYIENKDLQALRVTSFGISKKVFNFYKDKIKTNEYLSSIGIPVPKKFSLTEINDSIEYFLKPINGCGSIGISKLKGCEIKKIIDIHNYIIQDICYEPEYTQECFYYNDNVYSITRERIASKSGVCTKTKISHNIELEQYANCFAKSTTVPHIFNMQFMKNSEGKYVCTDLNLRTAGGMSLSYSAGWDEVSSLAKIMLNKPAEEIISTVSKKINSKIIIRAYTDIVSKEINKNIAFDLDGTLLDSRKRHSIVMDKVLQKRNIKIDTSNLVQYKSNKKTNLDWLNNNGIPNELAKDINNEWVEKIENKEFLKIDELYPNIFEFLETVSKSNDLYLITSRTKSNNLMEQLNNLDLIKFFEKIIIVSGKKIDEQKSKALIENNIEIMVGDTEIDYNAAQIAGCDFYATTYGFRSESFWKNKNCKIFDIKNMEL